MEGGTDTELMGTLNEIFAIVLHSGATRLHSSTTLSSLMVYADEQDKKKRHKYESIMEEMRSVRDSTLYIHTVCGVSGCGDMCVILQHSTFSSHK